MAENVTLDPTTTSGGAVVHTDELSSGAHVQRIKIGTGDPGTYSDIDSANPLPVSVGSTVTVTGTVTANAGTGTQSVSDGAVATNTNTINTTLQGTLSVSDGALVGLLQGTLSVSDGAVATAITDVTTSGALRVNIDSTNIAIGGGTQYSVGTSGIASAGVGNFMIATRDDTLSTLANGEGEAIGLRVDSTGALWVNNVGTAPTAVSDGAVVSLLSGTLSVSDGAVVSGLSSTGAIALALNEVTTAGTFGVTIESSNIAIGGGTQYSVGTSGMTSTGVGTLMIATRDDALSTLASGEGQAIPLRVDSTGALWVTTPTGDAETTDGATALSLGVTRQINVGFVSVPDGDDSFSVGAGLIGMAGMDSERALYVHIKSDSAGIGGGTQYSVGTSGLASAGTGTLMIGVRDDSLTTLASGEGEGVPLRVSSTGALHVTGGGGGTEYTEDVAAAGDPVGGAILLVRADTPATITDTDGDNVAQRATNYGAAYTQIVNSSGNFVDTFGGGTQYSVGVSGLTSAGTGTLMIATRDDALSALANGETEAIPLRVDANGALWVIPSGTVTVDGSAVTQPVSDGAVVAALGGTLEVSVGSTVTVTGTVTANAGTGTLSVSDGAVVGALAGTLNTSDGAVVAALGNKLEVSVGSTVTVAGTVTADAGAGTMSVSDGAVVSQLSGTLSVSDGAIVGILNSATDTTGALLVTPNVGLEASIAYHDQTVTTGSIAVSSGFTAGGAGQYNYITDVELTNSSATDTVVQLRDGAAGAVFWTMSVPANGGNNRSFARPLKQPTANTVLAFDPLTAVTTIYISINGFQAQG